MKQGNKLHFLGGNKTEMFKHFKKYSRDVERVLAKIKYKEMMIFNFFYLHFSFGVSNVGTNFQI
jgi:hypothetical protein